MSSPPRFPIRDGRSETPPDFSRALLRLSDDELREELGRARGLPDETHAEYRQAVIEELERRDPAPRRGPSLNHS